MLKHIDNLALSFGKSTREALAGLGSIGIFFAKSISRAPKLLWHIDILFEQMFRIGIGSLPIVALISVVTGFILAWQGKYLAGDVFPLTYLGGAVGSATFTQMGPTFTALILSGRISANLASELGTMKVSTQLDAMRVLSLDPYFYLFSPRIIAGFIMTTILFVFSSSLTIFSAQILATTAFDLHPYTFYNGMKLLFRTMDVVILLIKGFIYGGILASVGCYFGYSTTGGAVGVGESTRNAVVASSVLVLLSDVVINQVFM